MPEQHAPEPTDEQDPATAQTALHEAIEQLTAPERVDVDRTPATTEDAVAAAALDDEDQAALEHLIDALRDAFDAGDATRTRAILPRLARLLDRSLARRATVAYQPPMVEQLADAVENSRDRNAGAGRSGSLLNLAALALLADIDATTATIPGDRCRRLRAWAARSGHWRATDPAYLLDTAVKAQRWLTDAGAILDPELRWTHPGRCPECGTAVVHLPSPDGDATVRHPALELHRGELRVTCRACPARWEGQQQLLILGRVLLDQHRSDDEDTSRKRPGDDTESRRGCADQRTLA